jgi:predicted DsbA family dithiol-disulfide isomerase
MTASTQHVTFYFDPICPFSYKTSLWIREVQKGRSIEIDWRFLSLQAINEGTESLKESHSHSIPAFRVMAMARREGGNESVDALYRSFGRLRHEERKDISESDVIEEAVREAGLDPEIIPRALADATTLDDLRKDHDQGVENGAFGVASIEINGDKRPFFGPVISDVPTGERAYELWDHFTWLIAQPEFFEIKRERH